MKRLLPIIVLLLATCLVAPPASAGETVTVDLEGDPILGPTTSIASQWTPQSGDSVIFVSNGTSSDWYIDTALPTLENVSVGVGLDGRLHTKLATDYHDPTGFSFMQETTIAGNLLVGNDSTLSIRSFAGTTGRLNIGGDITLGTVGGTGTGELTVDNDLVFTGANQTVKFLTDDSRLQVQNVLAFGSGSIVTVEGGSEGEFEVWKRTSMTDATLRLQGKAMSFHEGVVVGQGARVEALVGDGTLYLGDSALGVDGRLTLAGGVLDGSKGRLVIDPKEIGGVKATASIAVTADSAIVGEVSSHDLDATISAAATVYNAGSSATWTVKNGSITSGGSLVLGLARDPALGGNVNGIFRLTDGGLTVDSGGSIVTATSQLYRNAGNNTWDSVISTSNIIGSGKGNGTNVFLNMASGSTLDLTNGTLFLDKVDATINGTIIFGGMDSGGASQTPYALVATNYTTTSGLTYGAVGSITIGSSATIVLHNDFASTFVNNNAEGVANSYNTLVDVSGTYLGQQVGTGSGFLDVASNLYGANNVLDLGLLGRFTLAVDSTGTKLYIATVERDFLLDGSADGLENMRKVVTEKYGHMLGQSDLATNIYRYASTADPDDPGGLGRLVADPRESAAHAVTSAYFDAVLRGHLEAGDTSAVNMYTGANVGRTINAAMDTMTVLHNTNMRHALDKRRQLMIVSEYVGGDEALAARIIDSDRENRIWAAPFGQTASTHTRRGFEGYYLDSLGITAGYDRVFGRFIAGGSASYIYGDYQDRSSLSSSSRIDSYAASLYGTYMAGSGFYATGAAGYVYGDHDLKELRRNYGSGGQANDLWNTANYGIKTWQVGVEAGYDIIAGDSLTITPSVGFNYIHAKAEDHHQNWGGAVIGQYTGMTARGKMLPVRIDLDYRVYDECETTVALTASGGYMHNFINDEVNGAIYLNGFTNATTMTAYTRNSGRNTYSAGAGLRVNKTNLDFNLNYDYLYRSNYANHQLRALVGVNF